MSADVMSPLPNLDSPSSDNEHEAQHYPPTSPSYRSKEHEDEDDFETSVNECETSMEEEGRGVDECESENEDEGERDEESERDEEESEREEEGERDEEEADRSIDYEGVHQRDSNDGDSEEECDTTVDERDRTVDESDRTVDESNMTVDENDRTVDEVDTTVDESERTEDEIDRTVDASERTVDVCDTSPETNRTVNLCDATVEVCDVSTEASRTERARRDRTVECEDQEVVDVESYQPSVVDLTCEDEDDIDVVEVVPREQPVIYVGTSLRTERRRNRRNRAHEAIEEDLTVDRPAAHQEEADRPAWPINSGVDFQDPELLFGNLLADLPVETVEDFNPRARPSHQRSQRELRSYRRQARSRSPVFGDRSRSPVLFPEAPRDSQRTPELVQDLDELLAEMEGRGPGPALGFPHTFRSAVQIVDEHNRAAQMRYPPPPPSPPAPEQPTISCMVCLDSVGTIQKSKRTLCSTVCGHVFCNTCIEAAFKQRKQCPMCRKRINKKQYHPLFI